MYEKIAVSACAVRLVGVDCIQPSAADSWLLYFLAYKAAFLSRIFLSLTVFQKNNASYSGILLAQVTCPEAIEISREVFIIDMGGEET
jgi:hypothetical protein